MERNEPVRLSAALGMGDLDFTAQTFGGGGNGAGAAVTIADAAITAGYAECVVVFRSLAQGQFGRYGQSGRARRSRGARRVHCRRTACSTPAQICAMQTQRYMHDHGVTQDSLAEVVLAVLRPRPAQPPRDPVWHAADARGVPRVAMDRRAAAPLRLLPGERRGCGDRRLDAQSGPVTCASRR